MERSYIFISSVIYIIIQHSNIGFAFFPRHSQLVANVHGVQHCHAFIEINKNYMDDK